MRTTTNKDGFALHTRDPSPSGGLPVLPTFATGLVIIWSVLLLCKSLEQMAASHLLNTPLLVMRACRINARIEHAPEMLNNP